MANEMTNQVYVNLVKSWSSIKTNMEIASLLVDGGLPYNVAINMVREILNPTQDDIANKVDELETQITAKKEEVANLSKIHHVVQQSTDIFTHDKPDFDLVDVCFMNYTVAKDELSILEQELSKLTK